MEPIVHHLTELCRDLTPNQFRLAIHPLMRCLPAYPGIGSPERAADCVAQVFARLKFNPQASDIRPTLYERQLAEELWGWDRAANPIALPCHQEDTASDLSDSELTHLRVCFERVKSLFEGTAIGCVSTRRH